MPEPVMIAKSHENELEPETPEMTAMRLSFEKQLADLKAMYESRDRAVETAPAEHLRDSLYAHGTAVPQSATAETIGNLASAPEVTFYVSPEQQRELGIPEGMTYVFAREPNQYKKVEGLSRPRQIMNKDRGAYVVEDSPWTGTDLVMMAVHKSYVEERDAQNERYRHQRESGMQELATDAHGLQRGIGGYVGGHQQYPDGRNPMNRTIDDLRAEHAANVNAGLIGPTSAVSYDDIMNGRVPGFTKERIEADEARHLRRNKHHSLSREEIREMAASTLSRSQTFSAGGVGFGPQTARERTQTLAAARQSQARPASR